VPFALIGRIFQVSEGTIYKQVQKYQQQDPDDGWKLAPGRPLLLTPAQHARLKEQIINSSQERRPWTICETHRFVEAEFG
jgi:transposase